MMREILGEGHDFEDLDLSVSPFDPPFPLPPND